MGIFAGLVVAPGLKAQPACVPRHHGNDGFDRRQLRFDRLHQTIEVRSHEQHLGRAVIDDIGHFRRRQAPVNPHGNRACLGAAENQFIKEIGVLIEKGHASAVAAACGEETLGDLAGMGIEGGVVHLPIFKDERRRRWPRSRLKTKHVPKRLCFRHR